MELGKIKGCDIRVQLFTVPGQVHYSSTRKLVLRGVDGIVFVADSLDVRREKNMLSLKDLQQNLKEYGLNNFKLPLVLQYNKRDLVNEGIPIMPIEKMKKDLNRQLNVPSFPASAVTGEGVGKTGCPWVKSCTCPRTCATRIWFTNSGAVCCKLCCTVSAVPMPIIRGRVCIRYRTV